jgi:hypothetical protein
MKMDQARLNHKATVAYGLPTNSTQQKIKEAIIKSENLVSDSADEQKPVNRMFLKRQNLSMNLLPD